MWTWRNCQISLPLAQLCKNAQHKFSHVPFGVSLLLSCGDNNHFPKGNDNFLIINDLMSETSKTPHLDAGGFHRIFSTFYSLWKAIFLRLTIQVIKWVLSNKQKNKQKTPQDKWWEAASVWQITQESLVSSGRASTEPFLMENLYSPSLTTRPSLQSGHLHIIAKRPLVILWKDGKMLD